MARVTEFCRQNCEERQLTVHAAKFNAKKRETRLGRNKNDANLELLGQISTELLRIAQKHISPSPAAYGDAAELVRCVKVLKDLGLRPEVTPRFAAATEATTNDVVTNSIDYRYLRNKAIAGFATIAELTEKPAAIGSADFQKGVREGYRRASDIAVIFLEDIQDGGR